MGMDQTTGQPRIAQSGDTIIQQGGFNTSQNSAPGTTTFTSGTGKQVLTTQDYDLWVPITYSPVIAGSATCKVEISADGTTYITLGTPSLNYLLGLGGSFPISLHMRSGYYLKITVTNATIGTATYW